MSSEIAKTSKAKTEKINGPFLFDNWKACRDEQKLLGAYEVPLFTDAHITGTVTEGYGPYQLHNTVPGMQSVRALRPSIVFRFDNYLAHEQAAMEATDEGRYHGGWLPHEMAALVSLCLGIRVKAGGITREFALEDDPKGRPTAWHYDEDPTLPLQSERGMVVPSAGGEHSLDDIAPISLLPHISSHQAIALMRAARLYQDGMWVAESEPNLSWIMLVSAVETAANQWRAEREPPLERLRAARPDLEKVFMEAGGMELTTKVAKMVAPFMGATKKFQDFMIEFLPEPPTARPWEKGRHNWDEDAMRESLKIIYEYRSRALHAGTPFPAPMCYPAMRFGDAGELEETPGGKECAFGVMGSTWLAKDIPMFLHLFEYLVRHCLLKWWKSLVATPS